MALSEKEKNVLTAGLILAGMFLFIFGYLHFFFFNSHIESNNRQIEEFRKKTLEKDKELAAMKEVVRKQDEVASMNERLKRVTAKLPSTPQAIEFLEELRASLERTGVRQTRVAPKPYVSRTLYTEIPYEVQGSARYHEFGQFLNIIECNPRRFMRINSIDIRENPARPSIHPVTVGISTFMFNKGG